MIKFNYGRDHLTSSIALKLARKEIKGTFHPDIQKKVAQSAKAVATISKGDRAVYGINTGFGPLCTTRISASDTRTLQENLLKSHAVGLGDPIPEEISKLMLIDLDRS